MQRQIAFLPGINIAGADVTLPPWLGRVLKIVLASALNMGNYDSPAVHSHTQGATGSIGGGGAHSHGPGTLNGPVPGGATPVVSDAVAPIATMNAGVTDDYILLAADIPAHTHTNPATATSKGVGNVPPVGLAVVTGAHGAGQIRLKDPRTIQHGDATDAFQVTALVVEVEGEGLVP